jgi:hypothetical protein
MPSAPRTHLPPRLLPIFYFAVAHVAFALACLTVALDPRGVSGFFYHSRVLAIVHLVTLGWISTSILGSLYVVGPVALRVWIPATWLDYTAFAFVLVGIVGMVAHFWLEEYGGMAWSAITVGMGIVLVGVHVAWCLRHASLPRAISAHIMLAFLNILVAATLGVLIGFDKVYHFLPGFVLSNVFAHAHLAALGWATMMVIGVAYRLLPMILPAAMPSGPRLWLSVVLLQTGVSGLFVSLLWRAPFAWMFALTVVGGLATFLSQVAWMLRRPRPRPPNLRSPDPAVLHAGASFVWLAVVTTWNALSSASRARAIEFAQCSAFMDLATSPSGTGCGEVAICSSCPPRTFDLLILVNPCGSGKRTSIPVRSDHLSRSTTYKRELLILRLPLLL